MIVFEKGKVYSLKKEVDEVKLLQKEFDNLSDEEKKVVEIMLTEISDGRLDLYNVFSELEYKTLPVGIEEFLNTDYFLGPSAKRIFPKWKDDLIELFSGDYYLAVITGAIGTGKCVVGDTEIYNIVDGRRYTVKEIFENGVKLIVASFGERNNLIRKEVKAVGYSGKKRVCRVVLDNGMSVRLSIDHKILTSDGWVEAGLLKEGSFVATPRFLPGPDSVFNVSDDEVEMVAYVLADGSCSSGNFSFTDERLIEEKYGLKKKSVDKRVPADFYALNDRQLGLFLNRFIACNGCVAVMESNVEIESVSEKLLDDLQVLLLRFGVFSKKSEKISGKFKGWRLVITGKNNKVGLIFGKEEDCRRLSNGLVDGNSDGDVVSIDNDVFWVKVKAVEMQGFEDVYDVEVPEVHNFVANGVVVHNTTFAELGLIRLLYELSCLRNPQETLGLMNDSIISLVNISVTLKLARKVIFGPVINILKESPYFTKECPFEYTQSELRFPNNIWVAPLSSSDTSILGLNMYGAIMDEGNFMDIISRQQYASYGKTHKLYSHADALFDAIIRRMKSRYMQKGGRVSGKLFILSSKRTQNDFIYRLLREYKDDEGIFCRDYALWDTRPSVFIGEDTFKVLVGNEMVQSRILDDEEAKKLNEREDFFIIDVPKVFKKDFERSIDDALRDIAGIATIAITPFFSNRQKITECVKSDIEHPFEYEVWEPSLPMRFKWDKLIRTYENGETKPIINPDATRFIHIDIGLRRDAAGFAMGHICGYKETVRRDKVEVLPIIRIDFVLRIVPPAGGEILLSDLRQIVYELSGHGFHIGYVSFDSYQCLTGDTKISLLNGRDIALRELVDLYKDTEFWVYSFDGEKIVPGRARNPRLTGKNVEVFEVELDNGARVKCTSGHPWLMNNGKYVLAKDLKVGDSVMSLYKTVKVVSVKPCGFEDVYDITVDKYCNFALAAGVFVHNSADSIQQLRSLGYDTSIISVDASKMPYENLKDVIYEGRLELYQYEILLKELRELEFNQLKKKVDHPEYGSKDVADAVCGVVYALSTITTGGFMPIEIGISSAVKQDYPVLDNDPFTMASDESTGIVFPL